jgi:hypothetical protein
MRNTRTKKQPERRKREHIPTSAELNHRGTEAQRRKSKKTGEAFNREIRRTREQGKFQKSKAAFSPPQFAYFVYFAVK